MLHCDFNSGYRKKGNYYYYYDKDVFFHQPQCCCSGFCTILMQIYVLASFTPKSQTNGICGPAAIKVQTVFSFRLKASFFSGLCGRLQVIYSRQKKKKDFYC